MPTTTLQQIEDKVYSGLDNNTLEFPEVYVRLAINEGLRRLNLLTGFQQATLPIDGNFTVAGRRQYSTPAGILIPLRVDYEGVEIQRVALERLARAYQNWSVDSSDSFGPVARWASIGLTTFVIHPVDALGGGLLEVTGVTSITPLVNPGDFVTLDDQFADILVSYAKMRVMCKEGGKPFADLAITMRATWEDVQEMTIWKGVDFPGYWLAKQTRPAAGRRR